MTNSPSVETLPRLVLCADTAADLMAPNLLSIRADAVIQEAIAFLADKGFSAAPVIDEAGRPVGVLSRSDILRHDRDKTEGKHTRVREIMTPAVFSVPSATPACKVVEQMLALNVHHLLVVGGDGVLVGIIGALGVLRHLR